MSDYDAGKETSWSSGFSGGFSFDNNPMSPNYSSYKSGQLLGDVVNGTNNSGIFPPSPSTSEQSSYGSPSGHGSYSGVGGGGSAAAGILGALIFLVLVAGIIGAILSPSNSSSPDVNNSSTSNGTNVSSVPTVNAPPSDPNIVYAVSSGIIENFPMGFKIANLKCGDQLKAVNGINWNSNSFNGVTFTEVYYPDDKTTAYVPSYHLSTNPPTSCQ